MQFPLALVHHVGGLAETTLGEILGFQVLIGSSGILALLAMLFIRKFMAPGRSQEGG